MQVADEPTIVSITSRNRWTDAPATHAWGRSLVTSDVIRHSQRWLISLLVVRRLARRALGGGCSGCIRSYSLPQRGVVPGIANPPAEPSITQALGLLRSVVPGYEVYDTSGVIDVSS
jgi:hypothetical protein